MDNLFISVPIGDALDIVLDIVKGQLEGTGKSVYFYLKDGFYSQRRDYQWALHYILHCLRYTWVG